MALSSRYDRPIYELPYFMSFNYYINKTKKSKEEVANIFILDYVEELEFIALNILYASVVS